MNSKPMLEIFLGMVLSVSLISNMFLEEKKKTNLEDSDTIY